MIIMVYNTRFENIQLEHPGGSPSRINPTPAAPQPAKVADRMTWLQEVASGPHKRIALGVLLDTDPYPPQPEPTRLEARHPASDVPDSSASIPCGTHCS